MHMRNLGLALIVVFTPMIASANEGIVFFEKKIRPALEKYCYRCHSDVEKKIKGNLVVDTKSGLLQGGDSGPAIVPGNLSKSILWKSITYANDMEMPPKKQMPDDVIADFKKWIEMGAPDPRVQNTVSVKSVVTEEDIKKAKKEFWSFKAPKVSAPPIVANTSWLKNNIDKYVLGTLEKKKMKPVNDADPSTLLRRLTFDLIGLPPTPAQVSAFKDAYSKDPDGAIEQALSYLLNSPHFGERWGRHWLDIARYAESNGRELNSTYPQAWRYRDYVIKSFNTDKPYDRFIQEQIAGDLLKADTDEQWAENLIATGFMALGPKTLTDQDRRQFAADLIDEQIDVVTKGIMGISVACARCHDHKFDPIPQADYYAIAGIFRSSKTYYGSVNSLQNRHRTTLIKLPVPDENPIGISLKPSEIASLKSQLDEIQERRREVVSKARSMGQENRTQSTLRDIRSIQRQEAEIQEKLNSVDSQGNPVAFCMGMQPAKPTNAYLFEKGEVGKPRQQVQRGFVQVIGDQKEISTNSSGRKELAEWISSKENPLTARVMVNNIWTKLIGQGLVRTPDNFGSTGLRPTHPELLDYLAVEFMKNNWSIKSMIRHIVTSRTYRMSSTFNTVNFKIDPDNKRLWRYSPKRLDAEVIRDTVLQVSGELQTKPVHGSIVAEQGHVVAGGRAFFRASSENMYDTVEKYRSVYLPVVRDLIPSFLKAFDFTESMIPMPEREKNDTPTQALFMLNNKFIVLHSDLMAKKLIKENSSRDGQIRQAFLLCYSREPLSSELSAARNLYNAFRSSKDLRDKKSETKEFVALSSICQALFSSAEFRYQN